MIDFQKLYAQWLPTQLAGRDVDDPQAMDELALTLYDQWLETPQAELEGVTPNRYFEGRTAKDLVDLTIAYAEAHLMVPDPLCDALAAEPACVQLLIDWLNQPLDAHQNGVALERLCELQAEEMLPRCFELIVGEAQEQADQAAQAVLSFGHTAAQRALALMKTGPHGPLVEDRLCDIIASCGPCEGAGEVLITQFERRGDARAFYAQCLAKLGDEAALDCLREALTAQELGYYDYTCLVAAIEALGEAVETQREFFGDRDYMALKEYE